MVQNTRKIFILRVISKVLDFSMLLLFCIAGILWLFALAGESDLPLAEDFLARIDLFKTGLLFAIPAFLVLVGSVICRSCADSLESSYKKQIEAQERIKAEEAAIAHQKKQKNIIRALEDGTLLIK